MEPKELVPDSSFNYFEPMKVSQENIFHSKNDKAKLSKDCKNVH